MAGGTLLPAGTLLQPQHLSLLASCGITEIPVSRKITVGILSTGNELIEPEIPSQKENIQQQFLAADGHERTYGRYPCLLRYCA